MAYPFRGWIVEGVVGAGKTTLINAYQKVLADRRPSTTKLFISEHYTERVLEDEKAQGRLTARQVLTYTDALVADLGAFATRKAQSKFRDNQTNAMMDVVVERFVGSHYGNLSTLGLWTEDADTRPHIERLYDTVQGWGLGILVLTLPNDALPAVVLGTRRHRNAAWGTYLDTLGDEDAVISYFQAWQERLLSFYASLSTPISLYTMAVPGGSAPDFYRAWAEALCDADPTALTSLGARPGVGVPTTPSPSMVMAP